jgi:hypothetical protein
MPCAVTAQHRVLVPEHRQLSFPRPVPAEYQDSQAEYLANQQVDDLEQHWPAGHHRARPAADSAGQPLNRVFERHTVEPPAPGQMIAGLQAPPFA